VISLDEDIYFRSHHLTSSPHGEEAALQNYPHIISSISSKNDSSTIEMFVDRSLLQMWKNNVCLCTTVPSFSKRRRIRG
jgi:hypothetical protein